MTFKHSIQAGYVELRFDGKPSERVRSILKGAGFRWNPQSAVWWRGRVAGAADTICAVESQLHRESGAPDGACWDCKSTAGYFRGYGAATPVYCDACEAKHREEERRRNAPDPVDMLYDDSCRQACGL